MRTDTEVESLTNIVAQYRREIVFAGGGYVPQKLIHVRMMPAIQAHNARYGGTVAMIDIVYIALGQAHPAEARLALLTGDLQ